MKVHVSVCLPLTQWGPCVAHTAAQVWLLVCGSGVTKS